MGAGYRDTGSADARGTWGYSLIEEQGTLNPKVDAPNGTCWWYLEVPIPTRTPPETFLASYLILGTRPAQSSNSL